MGRNVDFEFTKNWGTIEKGTVKSFDRALARDLQDIRKKGKILGVSKSKAEIETLEQAQAEMEVAVEERVNAVKKSAEDKVVAIEAKSKKAQELAEGKVQKSSKEITDMKAELAKAKKELVASQKMQKVTQNKLDKTIKARSTK